MAYTPREEDKPHEVPLIYDEIIQEKLSPLTLDELEELSDKSGTTINSGYLMQQPADATREDYIEEISEVGDKAEWQVKAIRKYLGIED